MGTPDDTFMSLQQHRNISVIDEAFLYLHYKYILLQNYYLICAARDKYQFINNNAVDVKAKALWGDCFEQ